MFDEKEILSSHKFYGKGTGSLFYSSTVNFLPQPAADQLG